APSNAVTVTSHLEDYPAGLPQPRINAPPVWECGRAAGVSDVVPGALVEVFARDPGDAGGNVVGAFNATPEWGLNWTGINPAYNLDARTWAVASLCEQSNTSAEELVRAEPATIEIPTLHDVYEGNDRVIARGPAPDHGPLTTGAFVDVMEAGTSVGSTVTPGGAGHIILVSPDVSSSPYTATQSLCTSSDPSVPVTPIPCDDLPPPIIKPPLPGDTKIELTDYVEGAEILVFANGAEIGHSGPPVINLSAPLGNGQTLTVVQRLGSCESDWVYEIEVECENLGGDDRACSGDWPAFRHNAMRSANQTQVSALSDPYQVKKLNRAWEFDPPEGRAFRASPVVHGDMVYIGNGNGRFYALDVATGAVQWEYPPPGSPALLTQYVSNPSSCGIAASAAIGRVQRELDVVIFAAPDPSLGAGLGSGRLFALDAQTGAEVWKSPEIAVLNGLTVSDESELHEQTGYAPPLVFGDRVYIGIANHGDNPIQNGRVVAVDLNTGNPVPGFDFKATSTRGGGVWSPIAGGFGRDGIFITTGNTRCWNGGCQDEPSPNHGLSMLRLNASSGAVDWKLQPVPFALDGDPDWSAGPSLLRTSCGDMVLSRMKDGWTYAIDPSATYTPRWQFPPTGSAPGYEFDPAWGTAHGDSRYLYPGAAWNDTYISEAGGEDVINITATGFGRLHAFNACGGSGGRVRWIADIPGATQGGQYQLGSPSVSHGIVFVGNGSGDLVAIADPGVWPSTSSTCSNPAVPLADCAANGFNVVPVPHVLANVDLGSVAILGEPALAGGRVFVASGRSCGSNGALHMLEPES
ncbi:MAG: PQQ-binding-like beta-propeller repeat protein, partial [Pseudomonadota bacterium]